MRSGATRSAEDRPLLCLIENLRQGRQLGLGGTHQRPRLGKMQARLLFDRTAQGNISGQGHDRYTSPRERGLNRDFQDPRHLLRLGNQLAVMAALRKEMFRVGLLKVPASNLLAWNLCRHGEDRNAAAVTVVEPVDQM